MISVLAPAFADPVLDAQSVFRTVMDAMARPGEVRNLSCDLVPPKLLFAGTAAVALALFDYETPVWLDCALADSDDVARWLRFHTGAPITDDMRQAAFAMIADARNMPDFSSFAPGTPDYPDRSATLILQLQSLSAGQALTLTGPGINDERKLSADVLPDDFVGRMIANRTLFPRGIDLLLVAENAIAAIPRSTHVVRGD